MFELCKAAFAAFWSRCTKGLLQIPRAIRESLNPVTEQDALRIGAQLDQVREGLRLFNYAYPLVGIVIGSIEMFHAPVPLVAASWLSIVAVSVTNEVLLNRGTPVADIVAHTRSRARMMALMTLVQTAVWISLVLCSWQPEIIPSNMFGVLIVSCTLAAISMRFAPHAAAVAGPMALLAALMIVMESIHGATRIMALFQLAIVYTALMVFQACATHHRFNRTWQLERDRELLIVNLHKAKAESERAHERAVAASKAKSEFLANMSHELRTPLNAIIGFSDIVRARTFGDASERYAEYGGFINHSGHHLLGLIGDILDFAKIDSGHKKLQPEPIDLMGLVMDEVRLARTTAATKGVSVTAKLPRSLPLLQADPHAARQILANLLSNAVTGTPSGGEVEVSVALNPNHEIALCVSDTGLGIAAADQAHFFDRFGQGIPEITSTQHGTGLGLPIVKGLVDMHGGRIELESQLGEGTRVTVIFPRASTLDGAARHAA